MTRFHFVAPRLPLTALLTLPIALLILLGTAFPETASAETQEASGAQKIVVHLSHFSDDLHAASMALEIATQLREGGASVTLFLDLEGVRLADSRLPRNLQWGSGPPAGKRYTKFVEAGGEVLLCPHCAEYAGLSAGKLRKGARIAKKGEIQKVLLEAQKVIDY